VEGEAELECMGDRDRLKQVLINLLRNAAEATRGLSDRTPEVRVSVEPRGPQVLIHIADNGSGIPPEKLDQIWEPFYTTKGDAGTGLGLDLVRQMVRAQDGEIEVRSEVGRGSTFTVALPRAAVLAEA
jgi:signal transduction histidine kinase